jgi:hypothetical protein
MTQAGFFDFSKRQDKLLKTRNFLEQLNQVVAWERSRVRARVEHIFGHISTAMNGCYVRTIGSARAKTKIGLENLAYNFSRYSFLMRSAKAKTVSA